jgi:hypothetical protein
VRTATFVEYTKPTEKAAMVKIVQKPITGRILEISAASRHTVF